MRTRYLSTLAVAFAAGITLSHAKLTVHEWGTFTVLQAPDGSTLTWYLGQNDVSPLPEFVTGTKAELAAAAARRQSQKASAVIPYAIRMETPVLYFYPDAPMEVKVTADFPQGFVSETYPHASKKGSAASWQGSLLQANAETLKMVPNADGPLGRHYAAARAVPDAWLFRQQPAATEGGKTPPAETDHFIFYRGAGNNLSRMITATTGDDRSFQITNRSPETVPAMFLLHVADGKSAWKRIEPLAPYKMIFDQEAMRKGKQPFYREEGRVAVSLPDASEPCATSTAGLKSEMLAALEKEGLTKAEAAAMVATWDNLWFEEAGTRVLAVLPQPWVDAVLPLKITPQPDAVERVFVARMEMISVEHQNALVDLLFKNPSDPVFAREQLRKLSLGRFASGAVDRAVAVKTRQVDAEMRARFSELNASPPVAAPVVGSVQ
ncbi:MAG TPA: hypothetical protein VG796_08205 [Verrucomicrobiales bacterium]|nr:hypothetical protein [Verrucomicrobiales bacterium]